VQAVNPAGQTVTLFSVPVLISQDITRPDID